MRHQYGRALFLAGRLEDAQRINEALLDEGFLEREWNVAWTHGLHGVIALTLGDTVQALEDLAQLESVGETSGPALHHRALIAAGLGEKERAVDLLRQAFAAGFFFSPWLKSRAELDPLRDYPPFQELMRPKG